MQERCYLGRKIKLLLGLCLLAGVCFWSAYRFGLFRRGATASPSTSRVSSSTTSAATISLTASSAPSVTQLKAATGDALPASNSPSGDDDTSTFVAFRYDKTRLLFRVGDEKTDLNLSEARAKTLRSLEEPMAEYDKDPTWEPDADLLNAHRELFDRAHVGEQWQLESAGSRIPVVVQKPVLASSGCFT